MYTHEYALLAAVSVPFLAIVGLNVYLWWGGERGTLLMPSSEALPVFVEARESVEEPMAVGCEAAPVSTAAQHGLAETVPANDVRVREAA